MCSKRPYYCKRDAETARNARMRSSRNRPDFLRIYSCPDCSSPGQAVWHMASNKHTTKDKFLNPLPGERQNRRRRWRD